ncbi:sensor protein QseC [Ferrovum sp. JA12]|uniref:ATP-binding protein n=1 Tax=Ferrovum sp. JA12 TaxID=1356299 RepID=UPI0007023FE1|nr:ATP-binding protein [Ferrovum sp. JA12]KRH78107.1 sensor protein QseC [Ferrovum sp. JA12]
MTSIRRRLIFLLIALLSSAWLVTALLTRYETGDEIDTIFDAEITQAAHILLGMARHAKEEIIEHGINNNDGSQPYAQTMLYQVWDSHGIVMRSLHAPEQPLNQGHQLGFQEINYLNQKWRLLNLWDENHVFHIVIAEPLVTRAKLARHITYQILLPTLTFFPFLGFLIWFTVRMGLTPLQKLRQAILQRNASRLEAIPLAAVPEEVLPLAVSINDLLNRLKRSLDSEKQFTGNAAHELRTPLAAIKTQAQVAMRADNLEDRMHALQQVIQGTERSTHLIEQLLILARVDPDNAHNEMTQVDLSQIAHKVTAELMNYAHQRRIHVESDLDHHLTVIGNPWQLEIVLRNLIDNALRYAPQPSTIQVLLRTVKGKIELSVIDQGKGIGIAEQEKIFNRFYRLDGTVEQGSGLGLSIVKRILELHQATISLTQLADESGFKVSIFFPK